MFLPKLLWSPNGVAATAYQSMSLVELEAAHAASHFCEVAVMLSDSELALVSVEPNQDATVLQSYHKNKRQAYESCCLFDLSRTLLLV